MDLRPLFGQNMTQPFSGWWDTYPSETYESQLGLLFPIHGQIKHIPNHQSVLVLSCAFLIDFSRQKLLAIDLGSNLSCGGTQENCGFSSGIWTGKCHSPKLRGFTAEISGIIITIHGILTPMGRTWKNPTPVVKSLGGCSFCWNSRAAYLAHNVLHCGLAAKGCREGRTQRASVIPWHLLVGYTIGLHRNSQFMDFDSSWYRVV